MSGMTLLVYSLLALTLPIGPLRVLDPGPPSRGPEFRLVTLAPGIHAAIEPREQALSPMVHGNTVFVVGESGVFAVDANRTPLAARRTLELLRRVTDKPVRWLLITHWHGDHWLGAQAFTEAFPNVAVIATDTARSELITNLAEPFGRRPPDFYLKLADQYDSIYRAGTDLAGRPLTPDRRRMFDGVRAAFRHYYAVEAPRIRPVRPTLTFRDAVTVHVGNRVIEARHVGKGDTPGDAVAWLPAERVLATGDMLVHPVPYAGSQVPSQWVESLRRLRALAPVQIVPGHGEVLRGTAYLDLVIETLDAAIADVRRLKAEGRSREEVAQVVTMAAYRPRFVVTAEPALADRWDDFIGQLVANAYAEAPPITTVVRTADMRLTAHGVRIERVTYRDRPAIKLSETRALGDTAGMNDPSFALLDTELEEGTIEISVAGTTRPGADTSAARGFTGIAFHATDSGDAYRAFYLRPLNSRSVEQLRRNRSVQYISIPNYRWQRLRAEQPGWYESYADLEPGAWTRLRIELTRGAARLFIDDSAQPSLVVTDLKPGSSRGRIALWIDVGTEAYFGDLTITRR